MNALLFERPIWFATSPLMFEEEAQDREEFIYHRPVLVRETIELLAPRAGALVLDATCGGGGHSEAILKTGADVLALDQDPDAIAEATNRLSEFGNRVTLRRANFRHADRVLDELEVGKIGGAILDLGVSSRQLENAERGFSLMRNGPLDMRMDPSSDKTAGAIINSYSEEELTRLFRERGREYVDRPEWPEPRPNKERDLLVITPRPVEPSENEQRFNARARSAKLRVAEKLG